MDTKKTSAKMKVDSSMYAKPHSMSMMDSILNTKKAGAKMKVDSSMYAKPHNMSMMDSILNTKKDNATLKMDSSMYAKPHSMSMMDSILNTKKANATLKMDSSMYARPNTSVIGKIVGPSSVQSKMISMAPSCRSIFDEKPLLIKNLPIEQQKEKTNPPVKKTN